MKEEKIISLLKRRFKSPKGIVGIGDDCAVLPYNKKEYLLFTTDTILEDVHFKISHISPYYIGYKALAVNISDIVAMGGIPLYAVINLGLPGFNLKLVDAVYRGVKKIACDFDVRIVGGDTVKSGKLFLAVCMIGRVEKKFLVKREGARAGDLIAVTGQIGNAYVSGKHYKFTPRLKEARWIVRNLKPSSMIDISDGLVIDLFRICQVSKKGAVIIKDEIPISSGVKNFYSAITEGEDFELLFTIPSKNRFQDKIPETKTKITIIGEITCRPGIYLKTAQKLKKIKPQGYDHFERNNFGI